MSQSDLIFFAIVAALASNYAVLRLPGWQGRMWLFWALQALNVSAASYLLVWGIPELKAQLPMGNWMLGLLFIFHTVGNNRRLQKVLQARRDRGGEDARLARIRDALRAGEE